MMKDQLKEIYLFRDLDDDTLEEISKITSVIKLSKDYILFYEGEKSKFLYLLTKGIIKVYKTSSNDKEIILKYFHANEFIAEVANFENIAYPATAQCFIDSEVLKIDFLKLKEIIYNNPKLAFIIQTSLIKKIRNLEKLVSLHIVLDSKERIAKYIYEQPEHFFNTKNILIAEILNISPETLSRMLKYFKDEGLVDTKNRTVNREKLEEIFRLEK